MKKVYIDRILNLLESNQIVGAKLCEPEKEKIISLQKFEKNLSFWSGCFIKSMEIVLEMNKWHNKKILYDKKNYESIQLKFYKKRRVG